MIAGVSGQSEWPSPWTAGRYGADPPRCKNAMASLLSDLLVTATAA